MKTFCKIMSFVLVVIMLLSFAACTGTTTPTPTPDNKTTEATATPTAQPTADTPTPTADTPAPTETAAPTESTPDVQPTTDTPDPTETTPTPTETDPPVEELKKPEINEKFLKADGTPEEVRFFVNTGDDEEWYDTLCTRSIAILYDGDKGPDPDYVVNAETIRRNNTVEEELGVKIVVKDHGSMQGTVDILKPILMAGNDEYDIMALYSFFDMGLAVKDTVGSFINYENMPEGVTSYIDPNNLSPWWNKQIYDTTKLTNPKHMDTPVNFFITGDVTQTNIGNMFVSFVNKTMWDRFAATGEIAKLKNSGGYDDIYQIVENGYWTMDLLIELNDLCYVPGADNPYGKPDGTYDQVGVLTYSHEQMNALDNMTVEYFSYGAHVEYTRMNSQGVPTANFNSENNMKFYEKLATMMCDTNCGLLRTEDPYIMEQFSKGNALMTVNELGKAENEYMQNMQDDFIVLPLPMLDHDQFNPDLPSKGYCSGIGDSLTMFSMCSTAGRERVPLMTATLELMGYYSKLWVTPAYYDVSLKGRFTRDETSKKMIDFTHEGIYSCFGLVWAGKIIVNCGGNQAGATPLTWYLRQYYDNRSDLAKFAKQGNTTLNASLKKLLNQLYEAWWVQI